MQKLFLFISLALLVVSCKQTNTSENAALTGPVEIKYAKGFTIETFETHKIITLTNPWPGADVSFRYLLKFEDGPIKAENQTDAVLKVPVNDLVVTSTTHIPSLEMLGQAESLIGFPNLDYISSETTRSLIAEGKIKELGKNEDLNTEVLIDMDPEVVVTFAVEGSNKTVANIKKMGIPVLYNSDWTETHPLGKAEWIKFFGALFNKQEEANRIFSEIERDYIEAKTLAANSATSPTVLSGAMYKDIWYLPQGDSWAAQFIEDAHGTYLWKDSEGTGSLSLNLESVLEKGQQAQFWIGPGQFTSQSQMEAAHTVYTEFDAFKNKEVYSFTNKKGATGGVLYYELAPNRPDLVLKDIIKILHPDVLPEHELYFFSQLEE
ncbi:MAG: ABC transporter substrate-binding protein [Flavobacteriaceae bacterium]|nr:ABC transporter substrate-binding protein [Flavobacteriaceae bacterium]